jgi:hypothetical protein
MTTTISLAARDFIAIGCDSLATATRHLLDPNAFDREYFGQTTGLPKVGVDGKPLLNHSSHIWRNLRPYPVDQLPSVMKIFDLKPRKAAALFAGAGRIGNVTVKNLVESFKDSPDFKDPICNEIHVLAEKLKAFCVAVFVAEYPEESTRPSMEILLSGYSEGKRQPEVFRLNFQYDWSTKAFGAEILPEVKPGSYNVIFGGQYDVIQRVVNGVDISSYFSLKTRCLEILKSYRESIQQNLDDSNITYKIPEIDETDRKHDLFGQGWGGVSRLSSDVGSLSEQAGIDFVTFLIHTMIKAQEFSSAIPTVGGDIHLGLITASDGFRWISKEEYKFQGHTIPKFVHA